MVRKVEVVPQDPLWAAMYKEEAALLASLLGEEVIVMHHFGSTAIPHIKAKPIIDILIEVHDIDRVDNYNPEMVAKGYTPMGEYGITGRRYFYKGTEEYHTHHVHIFQTDNPEFQRHLNFRDYMITHPEEAQRYSALKEELSARYPEDITNYVEGKNDYVRAIEKKANDWVAERESGADEV